jgi:hypothetical protein
MATQKQPYSFKEAIQEYFKLKNKYDTMVQTEVHRISRNKDLTKREKRAEFKSFRPKCINCQRPVGTLFSSKFDKEKDYRILSAFCGDVVNPCDLRIVINAGKGVESYVEIIQDVEDSLKEEKNQLIRDKNNLLFGYITTEEALEHFDVLKKDITELTNSYTFHLEEFNDITDNPKKKEELNLNQETAYQLIQEIKDLIQKFDGVENASFINDAVEIYVNQLQPLLSKVRNEKYSTNRVEWDDQNHSYSLVQEKYNLTDIESALVLPEVLEFHLGTGNTVNRSQTRKARETINVDSNKNKTRKNRSIVESVVEVVSNVFSGGDIEETENEEEDLSESESDSDY